MPRFENPPYYITAYGLAVKRGFKGTLDEWLKSLEGQSGEPAVLESVFVVYQAGDTGTQPPVGVWGAEIPSVGQGKYLWTKVTITFNTGEPIVFYSVTRMGIDGSGSVSSVAGINPNPDGNIPLTAKHLGAISAEGDTMKGPFVFKGPLILTEGVHYGPSEPATGQEGQLFLVEITE